MSNIIISVHPLVTLEGKTVVCKQCSGRINFSEHTLSTIELACNLKPLCSTCSVVKSFWTSEKAIKNNIFEVNKIITVIRTFLNDECWD